MIALFLAAALAAPPVGAPSPPLRAGDCISVTGASSASYTPTDDHTIVVTSGAKAWRITTEPNSLLRDPSVVLLNEVRGSSILCGPLDFQLSALSQPGGFRSPLLVREVRPISPLEAKALRTRPRR